MRLDRRAVGRDALLRLARLQCRRPKDQNGSQDKDRGDRFGDPSRVERAKDGPEADRNCQLCHSGAHPSREGALVRQNRPVFGPVGAVFSHLVLVGHHDSLNRPTCLGESRAPCQPKVRQLGFALATGGVSVTETRDDARTFMLMVLLAFWAAAWGYSLVPLLSAGAGDDQTGGLVRLGGFLGWQGIAGMFALALWGLGRGFPKRSGVRRISLVPLGMALALLLALIGTVIWARFGHP